uniref:Uncharacterized protein n=1 Tax=Rhizophora mucronata TaxID=61149 RepID=A0A2P2QG63_RHIMU
MLLETFATKVSKKGYFFYHFLLFSIYPPLHL